MNETPRSIPLLFGSVMFLMGSIILGALLGIVPTDGGRFTAPPTVIAALGLCLLFGAFMLWLPRQAPVLIRTVLLIMALDLLAVVCNWTAFAPDVVYYSSTSIGPVTITGEDQVGGRIVFGFAAVVVDVSILSMLIGWVHSSMLSKQSRRAD
jgi:cytochrome c oxidase assembly factor CtaG